MYGQIIIDVTRHHMLSEIVIASSVCLVAESLEFALVVGVGS